MTRIQQRTYRPTGVGKVVVALMMVLAACVATAGSAHADARPDFSAQAKGAGLSSSEARALQAEADANVARWGGTQVAANKIRVPGGELTLALPGEKHARDLGAKDAARAAASSCPYTYVCAYSGTNFTGDELRLFTCNYPVRIYWNTTGSWKNNQRAGLSAKFYDSDGILRWTSPGGYSQDTAADWRWVWYLSPC